MLDGCVRVVIMGLATLIVLAGCTSTGESSSDSTSTSTTIATTTTSTTTAAVTSTVTVVETVPDPSLSSEGHVRVGAVDYEFAFECFEAGAGDVLAVGVGAHPETGETVEAVVQAFFGQPYVGVLFANGDLIELDVDRQAELFVQDSRIRGTALRFVQTGTNAGDGEELGLGSVLVACADFAFGLPEGYELG